MGIKLGEFVGFVESHCTRIGGETLCWTLLKKAISFLLFGTKKKNRKTEKVRQKRTLPFSEIRRPQTISLRWLVCVEKFES